MGEVRKTKELDHYLKRIILLVPDKIQQFIDNEEGEFSMTYYTGDWSKDIYDNFTELQAEKIFKRMAQFQNKISHREFTVFIIYKLLYFIWNF